ncbi:MAG: L-glutamate gamma-semialdehyde dehydrogenase [Planctomycetaceae bacterium]|nr:L-glutamate gamma-semialdehyde dehydrogenase [Planctomycetaceae bacterium]
MSQSFLNEPFTDFSDPDHREAFQGALRGVRSKLGAEYPLIIGGQEVSASETFRSYNPSRKDEIVGVFQKAGAELAEDAVEKAHEAFERWRKEPVGERAAILRRTAALLRERKHEFSAWMVYEVGKSWPEADGDTAEAIDFLEFYANEAERIGEPKFLGHVGGDDNVQSYLPLGVVAVIPPWNFPLAIMAGMTVASVATGNAVVLKPSSDAPTVAAHFVALLHEAGLPRDVLSFLPGSGSIAGEAIVRHHLTRMIAFTGSREVGLGINEAAARMAPGQRWIKRIIAEMGGKDGIIVDASADLDEAAKGVGAAAFGYQGQKCSACSRAIVHKDVYDEFVEKLLAEVAKIRVGDPEDPDNSVAGVINRAAYDKILSYVETGKGEGTLLSGGEGDDEFGYFVAPTVIGEVDARAKIAQEEIFGPVLAVIKAGDFDHALEIANDTEYGLTGAIYAKDEELLARGAEEFFVGNLYLNRKCTGALVQCQPFGGFNMSGTDSKAGGQDYLLLFSQAKVVATRVG